MLSANQPNVTLLDLRIAWRTLVKRVLGPRPDIGRRKNVSYLYPQRRSIRLATYSERHALRPCQYRQIKYQFYRDLISYLDTDGPLEGVAHARALVLPAVLRYTVYFLVLEEEHDAGLFLKDSLMNALAICSLATLGDEDDKGIPPDLVECGVRLLELAALFKLPLSFGLLGKYLLEASKRQSWRYSLILNFDHTRRHTNLLTSCSHDSSETDPACLECWHSDFLPELRGIISDQIRSPDSFLWDPEERVVFTVVQLTKAIGPKGTDLLKNFPELDCYRYCQRRLRARPGCKTLLSSVQRVLKLLLAECAASLEDNTDAFDAPSRGTVSPSRSQLSGLFKFLWQNCAPTKSYQSNYENVLRLVAICDVDLWIVIAAMILARSQWSDLVYAPKSQSYATAAGDLAKNTRSSELFPLTVYHLLSGSFRGDPKKDGFDKFMDETRHMDYTIDSIFLSRGPHMGTPNLAMAQSVVSMYTDEVNDECRNRSECRSGSSDESKRLDVCKTVKDNGETDDVPMEKMVRSIDRNFQEVHTKVPSHVSERQVGRALTGRRYTPESSKGRSASGEATPGPSRGNTPVQQDVLKESPDNVQGETRPDMPLTVKFKGYDQILGRKAPSADITLTKTTNTPRHSKQISATPTLVNSPVAPISPISETFGHDRSKNVSGETVTSHASSGKPQHQQFKCTTCGASNQLAHHLQQQAQQQEQHRPQFRQLQRRKPSLSNLTKLLGKIKKASLIDTKKNKNSVRSSPVSSPTPISHPGSPVPTRLEFQRTDFLRKRRHARTTEFGSINANLILNNNSNNSNDNDNDNSNGISGVGVTQGVYDGVGGRGGGGDRGNMF